MKKLNIKYNFRRSLTQIKSTVQMKIVVVIITETAGDYVSVPRLLNTQKWMRIELNSSID